MVVSPRPWLIDKSALVRIGGTPDAHVWADRIERGMVRVAAVTLLETGYSARTAEDLDELLDLPPLVSMPVEYQTPAAEDRALEVLRELALRGRHRAPSIPDLLIAAIAERSKLTVLHADKDFELIADITGQPMDRLQFEGC
ncbi:PIN domain nuclease [Nocardia sp. NPDC058640]|uniref:PIN domain nuclease n=1 Tax=Nocardia sp. NPDC058640 TaxID=3346571 RepID=UPI003657B70A